MVGEVSGSYRAGTARARCGHSAGRVSLRSGTLTVRARHDAGTVWVGCG